MAIVLHWPGPSRRKLLQFSWGITKAIEGDGVECASPSVDEMKAIETIAQTAENAREFSNFHQFLTAVASIISVAVYAGNAHNVTFVSPEEANIYTYGFGYSFIIQCFVPVVVFIGGVLALTEKMDGKEVGHEFQTCVGSVFVN